MGIQITEDSTRATILCAPSIKRTRKFVTAIAYAPEVVDTSFLETCLKRGEIPSLPFHYLSDRETENRLGFRLDQALFRAQQNKRKLLDDFEIFLTDGPNFATYKDIISSNGGEGHLFKINSKVKLDSREKPDDNELAKNRKEDERDVIYLISGFDKKEVALWKKFREMVKDQGLKPRIVQPDWLLAIAMSQKIERLTKYELSEENVPAQ